jgi:hypothetical protein
MGWASAGEIFNMVARWLLAAEANDELLGEICYKLAKKLTDEDGGTVDESIEEFRGFPVVQNALRRADGRLYVDDDEDALMDYSQQVDEWVLTIGGEELGRRPGTVEGHNQLIDLWFADGPDTPGRRYVRNEHYLR